MKSIKTAFAENQIRISQTTLRDSSSEDTTQLTEDIDPEQTFYRAWGYLPPLDEEAAALVDAIIANPEMAIRRSRINTDSPMFAVGLGFRNVSLRESKDPDLQADIVKQLLPKTSVAETDDEKHLYGQLWIFDQAKCGQGSSEALFQRILMMNLIARHFFVYGSDTNPQDCLYFSVEEPWACPPMPTRAYERMTAFLTQPRPDLAVCFRRQALIEDDSWWNMPTSTKRLACFENLIQEKETRVFHFFTIEAKKANIGTDDSVGGLQSLNNASQALYNMFEFFRDAGGEHENIFLIKCDSSRW